MAGKLAGTVALIAGGAGTVGSGIVKGFLDAGARVVVPSRTAARLEALSAEFGNSPNLYSVVADVGTEDGAAATLQFIDEKLGGQLDHVVTSLGGGVWGTPVIGDKPERFFLEAVHDHAGSHYVVANAALPRIADKPGSSFLFISGGLGGAYFPGAGFTSIAAGALWGLSLVVRAEMAEKAVRVNELRVSARIARGSSISYSIGELVAAVAAGTTDGAVLSLNSEADIPGLKQKYA